MAVTGAPGGRPVVVAGCGLVGGQAAAVLAARGAAVVCADVRPERATRLAERTGGTGIALDAGDWAATHRALAGLAPAAVVHAAGRFGGGAGAGGEADAALVADTARAAFTLAHAAAAAGADRVVLVSSLGVYGRAPSGPVDESAPLAAASAYGAAKIAAEAATAAATCGTGTATVVLRLSGVVGGVPRPDGGRLNAALFRLVAAHLAGRPVRVGAGFAGREYLDVRDAAAAVAAAAVRGRPGAVHNVGTGRPLRAADVVAALREVGAAATAEPDADRQAARWWLDVDSARRDLRWRPTRSLADTLRGWIDQLRTEGDDGG